MALIDRAQMLSDVKLYLPEANALSDEILNNNINHVIDVLIPDGQSAPIDDDQFYSEDLCKTLKISALQNKTKHAVDNAAIKKDKVDGVEIEQFGSITRFVWDDYLKSLPDICPYLPGGGYKPSRAIGAKISPGKTITLTDCECPKELTL